MHAADVEIPDIRAGLAFVVAALIAKGTSTLTGVEHLERGYERLEEKLRGIGAQIERQHTPVVAKAMPSEAVKKA
ncbi:MAG: UDP-N-acetylglucosamine 1-carboxyvinyltransferase [Candidatus Uhrbacteria bacterium GW2011_GWA2_53_10]|uniref:UDP-N-acetylglucosamine 1-carboxyvinyltransferase n=1 Tax=Candidatus Uhrbacteria bacterium GW2011_GWA2_53_10 TaxID=1618980 RepID=A0A0G1XMA7_9BACT|nr:MAG: UDP-N-acetylglucosamine 1-carboxyvinyltransferase [Candidatus Uhrbacteria bacterium GW2011_GWA2_53_10]